MRETGRLGRGLTGMNQKESEKTKESNENVVPTPHKPNLEDEEPGQSAVGKHTKTQREQNEERDRRATR